MVNLRQKWELICCLCFVCTIAQGQAIPHSCKATYYHDKFENRKTTSGEIFLQSNYTAAHKTIPLHSFLRVTNIKNNLSVIVKVNDRCPKRGIIDLSFAAAEAIELDKIGVGKVTLELLSDTIIEEWDRQKETIPPIVQARRIADSISHNHNDSLLFSRTPDVREVAYYSIQVATVKKKNTCRIIQNHIPEEYRERTRAIFMENKKQYKIVIRPFFTKVEAEECLKQIKKTYPTSYLKQK